MVGKERSKNVRNIWVESLGDAGGQEGRGNMTKVSCLGYSLTTVLSLVEAEAIWDLGDMDRI